MSGFYLMHRGWWQNPAFRAEPFTEREAWMWLIEAAAWRPEVRRIKQFTVDVARGQVAASLRYMAEAWSWAGEARVRRYLARLQRLGMVRLSTAAGGVTVITVVAYDSYQQPIQPTQQRRSTDAVVEGVSDAVRGAENPDETGTSDLPVAQADAVTDAVDNCSGTKADAKKNESNESKEETPTLRVGAAAPRVRRSRVQKRSGQQALLMPLPTARPAAAAAEDGVDLETPAQRIRRQLWSEGRQILSALKPGLTDERMGQIIGGWVKTLGGNHAAVIQVLRDVETEAAEGRILGDPIQFAFGVVMKRANGPAAAPHAAAPNRPVTAAERIRQIEEWEAAQAAAGGMP